ncbi:hypothetical protein POPTR_010G252850v4 [Populus trichocarpa]|uniref:SAUR family protein n=1 Tax=Populus trichocarpa TaxID=3694 RepID=B9HV10_POPTR|nr:hypothetical protein POPTR_010G252850v4 [Populus trichocarpa]
MKGSRALLVSSLLLTAACSIMLARSSRVDSPHAPKLVPFPLQGQAPFAGITLTRPLAIGNQARMQGIFSECTQLCF